MGGDFDFMDERSHHTASGLTEEESGNRDILRHIMESSGFESYCNEWWHYVLADEPYPDTYFDFCIAQESLESASDSILKYSSSAV